MRTLRQIAVGIYLVVFILASTVAIRLFAVGLPLAHPPGSPIPAHAPLEPRIHPESITAASESIFLFLSAPAAQDCARFIHQSDQHQKSLDAFVLQRIPQDVQIRYTRSDATQPADHSFVHWFELTFEKERRRFDVAAYPTPDGYRINWPEFHDAYSASTPEVAGRFKAPPAPIPGAN